MMIMMMSKTEFKTDSIDWLNAQIEVFSKEIVVKFPRSEHSIQEYVESLKAFATDNSLVISSIVIGTAYSIITFERKRRNSKKYTAIATIAFETTETNIDKLMEQIRGLNLIRFKFKLEQTNRVLNKEE